MALAKKGLRKKKTEGFLSGAGMVVFMQCDSYFAYDIYTLIILTKKNQCFQKNKNDVEPFHDRELERP